MTPTRNPTGHAGLLGNFLALASAITEFFAERVALFSQESKAANPATGRGGIVFYSSRSSFGVRIYFSHRRRCCGPGPPSWNLVDMDSVGCCWSAFCDCAHFIADSTQPNQGAVLSRDIN